MFMVAVGARSVKFLSCPYFGSPSWLWGFSVYCSLSESVSYSFFSFYPELLFLPKPGLCSLVAN